jgi:hypothetical protein
MEICGRSPGFLYYSVFSVFSMVNMNLSQIRAAGIEDAD